MPFQVCDIFKAKLCTTLHISSIVFFISPFGAHYRTATSVSQSARDEAQCLLCPGLNFRFNPCRP